MDGEFPVALSPRKCHWLTMTFHIDHENDGEKYIARFYSYRRNAGALGANDQRFPLDVGPREPAHLSRSACARNKYTICINLKRFMSWLANRIGMFSTPPLQQRYHLTGWVLRPPRSSVVHLPREHLSRRTCSKIYNLVDGQFGIITTASRSRETAALAL